MRENPGDLMAVSVSIIIIGLIGAFWDVGFWAGCCCGVGAAGVMIAFHYVREC